MFILALLATALLPAVAADGCPSGWTFDGTEFCYLLTTQVFTYDRADKFCQDNGGVLATVSTNAEATGVRSVVNSTALPPFLGAYKNATNGKWQYATGETFYTSDWAKGEPSDYGGDCVVYRTVGTSYGMMATACYNYQPALCRQSIAVCNGGNFGGSSTRSGNISSPNYPVSYFNNLQCYYAITGPTGTYITIDFDPVEIEGKTFDYIVVYEGTDNKTEIGRINASNPEKSTFETTGSNKMLVYFRTDSSIVKKGWLANWRAANPSTPVIQNGSHGVMSSPNYPDNYPNYAEQYYYINGPDGFQIQATFDYFDTEANYDKLTVYDGPNVKSPKIGNFSGHNQPKPDFLSTGNTVTMTFITDGSVVYKGFNMSWIAV